MKHEGYEVTHDGKCITIFSAPNYCDFSGNSGAYIRLNGKELKPKFIQFSAVVLLPLFSPTPQSDQWPTPANSAACADLDYY